MPAHENINRNSPLMDQQDTASLRFAEAQLTTGVRLHYAERGDSTGHPLILLMDTRIRGSHTVVYCHYSLRTITPTP